MNRRRFITGMAGILAASQAPAIVSSTMPIYVPKPNRGYLNGIWMGETGYIGVKFYAREVLLTQERLAQLVDLEERKTITFRRTLPKGWL